MGKGGDFERTIAKYLTKWITGSEKPYCIWRSPGSGAMATLSEENKKISGDLHALRKEAVPFLDNWSVELKTGYPAASLDKHLKKNKNNVIEDFWEQCTRDAKNADKNPMLIYRKKGMKPWVGIIQTPKINRQKLDSLRSITLKFDGLPPLTFFDMEEFFSLLTLEDLI